LLVLKETGEKRTTRKRKQHNQHLQCLSNGSVHEPPLKDVMDSIAQRVTQDIEPDPDGGPGARRIKQHGASDRRISIEDEAMRHGRKSSTKTFHGFKGHFVVDLASTVTREVVVRPANEPESAEVELLAEELEKAPGLLQLDIDLEYMASPRMLQWEDQRVYIIARPWPQVGPLFTNPKESRWSNPGTLWGGTVGQ
jgi:hypothetical protein